MQIGRLLCGKAMPLDYRARCGSLQKQQSSAFEINNKERNSHKSKTVEALTLLGTFHAISGSILPSTAENLGNKALVKLRPSTQKCRGSGQRAAERGVISGLDHGS